MNLVKRKVQRGEEYEREESKQTRKEKKKKINKRAFFKTKKKTRNEVVCFNLRRPVSKLFYFVKYCFSQRE